MASFSTENLIFLQSHIDLPLSYSFRVFGLRQDILDSILCMCWLYMCFFFFFSSLVSAFNCLISLALTLTRHVHFSSRWLSIVTAPLVTNPSFLLNYLPLLSRMKFSPKWSRLLAFLSRCRVCLLIPKSIVYLSDQCSETGLMSGVADPPLLLFSLFLPVIGYLFSHIRSWTPYCQIQT